MPRTLKFKAWDKEDKKMEEVFMIDFQFEQAELRYTTRPFEDIVLLEYTGILDKNGKEIYEGDIIIDTIGPQIKMIVKWIDDCAGFRTTGNYNGETYVGYVGHENKFGRNTCQVIGNIYENPEWCEMSF